MRAIVRLSQHELTVLAGVSAERAALLLAAAFRLSKEQQEALTNLQGVDHFGFTLRVEGEKMG